MTEIAPLTRRELRERNTSTRSPKKARGGVISALLTGLSLGALLFVLAIAALAIVVPRLANGTALTVVTSSMEPALPPGTLVVVTPTAAEDIQPGDVLTYQLRSGEPTLVTHRVTQQLLTADGERLFITQGDANPHADPDPVREVQVRGTVWYAIPYLGWVSQIVTSDVRAIVIPALACVLAIYAAWMFVSGLRERSRRQSTAAPAGD
ncbi:signal peptidase I [Microbacterium sp. NC79]|uniref:signal peptidase I n=1 Tax=Microbacterium sp. NC79 TaxID=2851009 RepID=UPI001C2BE32E|nr:signal peptidase I [Microbacterium sp. NC79]MBV0895373.1 signal peptidase I [Microbacterium sp. NC79]